MHDITLFCRVLTEPSDRIEPKEEKALKVFAYLMRSLNDPKSSRFSLLPLLQELKSLVEEIPYFEVEGVLSALEELAGSIGDDIYASTVQGKINKAKLLEKQKDEAGINAALRIYWDLVASETDRPLVYKRIAIISRKRGEYLSEKDACDLALQFLPADNPHRDWFVDRKLTLLDIILQDQIKGKGNE